MLETLLWMIMAATLVPAHAAAARHSPRRLVALLAVEVVAVGLAAVAWWSEVRWAMLAQEDGPVEWATFAAFALAAVVVLGWVRRRAEARWVQVGCWLLALFFVAVAGEEISWGQRLVGFKPPEIFLDRNFQQELNLHNVLMHEGGLGFKLQSKHLVMAIAIGFGLLWPLLVRLRPLKVFAPLAPPLAFAPIALAIVASEVSYPVELTGEGAELLCGLLFLASAVLGTSASANRTAQAVALPMLAGLVLAMVLTRLAFGDDDAGRAAARAELAQLQADLVAGAETPQLTRRSIHKRIFTAVRDGYLHLAGRTYLEQQGTPAEPSRGDAGATRSARHDRRGYFLDPWNNPYWISFNRSSRDVVLYSFGPNRRRDLVVKRASAASGDDVVLRFHLDGGPVRQPTEEREQQAVDDSGPNGTEIPERASDEVR